MIKKRILANLLDFFTGNPENQELIPKTVEITLWHYQESSDKVVVYGQIQGQGEACGQYTETLKNFQDLRKTHIN